MITCWLFHVIRQICHVYLGRRHIQLLSIQREECNIMTKDDYLPLEKYGELGTDVIISLLQNTLHTMSMIGLSV